MANTGLAGIQPDQLYLLDHLLEFLGYAQEARIIRPYIREGSLRAARLGNKYLIYGDDFIAFARAELCQKSKSSSDAKGKSTSSAGKKVGRGGNAPQA